MTEVPEDGSAVRDIMVPDWAGMSYDAQYDDIFSKPLNLKKVTPKPDPAAQAKARVGAQQRPAAGCFQLPAGLARAADTLAGRRRVSRLVAARAPTAVALNRRPPAASDCAGAGRQEDPLLQHLQQATHQAVLRPRVHGQGQGALGAGQAMAGAGGCWHRLRACRCGA